MGAVVRLASILLLSGLLIFGSYGKTFAEPSPPPEEAGGFHPALYLVNFYREHISPIDGDRCPSLPSCSSYSLQAIQKHGFFLGWLMTVDRLLHEGQEETRVSPLVLSEGKWKIFDPVWNNDFWWYLPAAENDKRHERKK